MVADVHGGMATLPASGFDETSAGILQRIGLFRARMFDADDNEAPFSASLPKVDPKARRRLLNDISSFLIDHDLDVIPVTLAAAHEACSGLNPAFARSVKQQDEAGEPVTQSWLEEVSATDPSSENRSLENLATKLERGIEDLSRATKTAREATSEYGDELERRVDHLNSSLDTTGLIASLSDFAKEMLARSRQAEENLRASEQETARLRKNLDRARKDAEVDYLTGLPNRRAFEEALRVEYAQATRKRHPLSVAYCDIDHFKAINDTHGHEAGDRIIRQVADNLSALCGKDCYIARHGGEEFALLFRGIAPEEALELLDGARAELAARRMINRRTDKPFGQVTFSGGVANVVSYADPREALAAADEALYRSKEGGRNQIRLADA